MENNIEHQNLQTQLAKSQINLKKITQFLLSVSVFSLLLSNFFGPSFLHSFNFYISTLPVQLFTHSLDKNCIFLLCNGLLVFVAKFSGLISSNSSNNSRSSVESFKNYEYERPSVVLEPSLEEEEVLEVVHDNNVEEGNRENVECIVNGKDDDQDRETEEVVVEGGGAGEGESGKESNEEIDVHEQEAVDDDVNDVDEDDDYHQGGEGNEELHDQQQQQQQEVYVNEEEEVYVNEEEEVYVNDDDNYYYQGNAVLSNEELNKKFEEFIRKMKEEIRIEARQQLVIVN